MKRFGSVIAGLGLVLLLSPNARAQTSAQPYELNAIIPMTGGGAFLGKAYAQAFQAVENVVNRTGGIQGRPLKFIVSDSQTNPQVSLQLVNGLIAKHAAAYIDGGPAAVCSASVPAVVNSGPLDYCLSPGIHPPGGSYVFSSSVSTEDLTKILVRYFRGRNWTRLALITSTDTTGQDLDRQIDTVLALPENKNVQLVAHEHFNTTDLSVAAQMAHIKSANPQVVITWSTGTPFGTLLHGLADAGMDVPVSTTDGNQTFAQMKAYGSFLPKQLYFPSTVSITPSTDAPRAIRRAQDVYFGAFREIDVRPDLAHNLVWDPAMILVDALRHLGPSAGAQQIRDYILRLHGWVGVNGVYDFTAGDQRGLTQSSAAVDLWDASKDNWVQVSRPGGTPIAAR